MADLVRFLHFDRCHAPFRVAILPFHAVERNISAMRKRMVENREITKVVSRDASSTSEFHYCMMLCRFLTNDTSTGPTSPRRSPGRACHERRPAASSSPSSRWRSSTLSLSARRPTVGPGRLAVTSGPRGEPTPTGWRTRRPVAGVWARRRRPGERAHTGPHAQDPPPPKFWPLQIL